MNVEKLADEEIGRATVYAIELNVSVSHDRIKVRVQDGSITLTGEVEWAHQRQAAEQAVRRLNGVMWVSDQITIKSPAKPVDTKAKIESAFQRIAMLNSRLSKLRYHSILLFILRRFESFRIKKRLLQNQLILIVSCLNNFVNMLISVSH
jgi:hypothetical protein